ncbi:MAG: hypothetical protein NZM00_09720, partial [Anaerolinea sp.]|nr:hypothetical protein [Anaerolinea sp.]
FIDVPARDDRLPGDSAGGFGCGGLKRHGGAPSFKQVTDMAHNCTPEWARYATRSRPGGFSAVAICAWLPSPRLAKGRRPRGS